jgi:hypothetical protein
MTVFAGPRSLTRESRSLSRPGTRRARRPVTGVLSRIILRVRGGLARVRRPAALMLAFLVVPAAGPLSLHVPRLVAAESAGPAEAPLKVFDLAGYPVDPFAAGNAKVTVFIFVGIECPISNRYAPEIRRLEAEFSSVRFWLVYTDPDTSAGAIEKHLEEYKLPRQALRDPRHGLVRLGQVRVTPEAAVFLPGRRLVYHGRIDNRYVELGRERPEATQRDLRAVLEAILQGKPVPYASRKAVGCYIPDLSTNR